MFRSARTTLTAWYIIIILAITGSISLLFYLRTVRVLTRQLVTLENRWQQDRVFIQSDKGQVPAIMVIAENLIETKRELRNHLLFINGGIAVIVGLIGYFLSAKTLAPIQNIYEEQKRFVGDAAHELKTPITALKTSIEVNLMDNSLTKKMRQILQENLEDVTNLERLTHSLLQLARQEQVVQEKTLFITDTIWTKALKTVKPLAEAKHITLLPELICNKQIEGNQKALTDVLIILLENAIKYSDENTSIVGSCKLSRSQIHISISDQGIGIPKQHLPHIFDRFYRIDASRTKGSENGHGLGLSIAKKIIDEHHGYIRVSSKESTGTTVTITLPFRQQIS